MRIAIDIDDTIANTTNYLMPITLKYDELELSGKGIVDSTKDMPRCFDWTDDELKRFFKEIFSKQVSYFPVMDNAREILKKLKNEGHEIVIVSSRNEKQMVEPYETTKKWLDDNGILYDELLTNIRYKGSVVEEKKIDLFIDDSIGQCTFIADNNQIPVILFGKETNNIEYNGVKRIDNWLEIYNYIKKLQNSETLTYQDILEDKEIIKLINKIDSESAFYMSHGRKHINSILRIIDKVCDTFNITDKDRNLIKIAGVLHDIGRSISNDNHDEESTVFASNYLRNKLSNEYIEKVLSMIKNHSSHSTREDNLDKILYFADKIDFSRDRLEDNYQEKYGFSSVLDHIIGFDFNIENDYFVNKIKTDGTITLADLVGEKYKYDIGIQYNTSELANAFGYKYKIYWDNNLLFVGDKLFELSEADRRKK